MKIGQQVVEPQFLLLDFFFARFSTCSGKADPLWLLQRCNCFRVADDQLVPWLKGFGSNNMDAFITPSRRSASSLMLV